MNRDQRTTLGADGSAPPVPGPSPRNGERHDMKKTALTLAFLVAWMFTVPMAWAQKSADAEHAELAKALRDAKISLQRGLTASTKEGKPISAKYEVEHGKLQLSVYTMKGDKFSEVIVDHKTGKEAKAEAKRSLNAAASEAVKENKGYRVVSVMPAVKDGHPVADVALVKGSEWKQVSEKLD